MEKFGVLINDTSNLGDEIQSLAAMQYLPSYNDWIVRDNISHHSFKAATKVIMNAWWMHSEKFPPNNKLIPLLISMHFSENFKKKIIGDQNSIDYLIKHGPVGCRDISTLKFLDNLNIPAYFSGCLTLTINKRNHLKKENYILLIDLPQEIETAVSNKTNLPTYSLTHEMSSILSSDNKLFIAQNYLDLYQQASFVITSRLHVALPCLALETPVLFFTDNPLDSRFGGLLDLLEWTSTDKIFKTLDNYDFTNPTPNPKDYLVLRNRLIEKVVSFIGQESISAPVVFTPKFIRLLEPKFASNRKLIVHLIMLVFKARLERIRKLLLKKSRFKKN